MKATTKEAYRLIHDGTLALSNVESNGMRIDTGYLRNQIDAVSSKIERLEGKMRNDKVWKRISRRFGGKASMSSRPQLGKVLFGDMGYKATSVTAKMNIKVDEEALESVDEPYVRRFIKCERLKKIRATNLKGILRETCHGILRPHFNLNIARSFRSSASDPNSQNWPIRNPELAGFVRPAFIPRKNHVFVEIDLKGAEVCVSACYNHDPVLIAYILNPKKDMHRDMAAQIFGLKKEQVSKAIRQSIKGNFVFAQFYGAWYKTCAQKIWQEISKYSLKTEDGIGLFDQLAEMGITEMGECKSSSDPDEGTFEAWMQKIEKDFWGRRFKVYNQWKEKFYERYEQRGYFDMKTGFRCAGLFGRKEVINYPVQGSAFHCLLQVLIWGNQWLAKHKLRSMIVGQIHDSILLDVHKSELADVVHKFLNLLTVRLPKQWEWIIVPLTAEVEGSDENWHQKKPLELAA